MHGYKWPINCTRTRIVRARRQEKEARARYAAMAKMSVEELDKWLRHRRVNAISEVPGRAREELVRVDIIGHARIRYVGKHQSCMI